MMKIEEPEDKKPGGSLKMLFGAVVVLLTGFLSAGCASVVPPVTGASITADPDEVFVQVFLEKYHSFQGEGGPELLFLDAPGVAGAVSFPGYSLPLFTKGSGGGAGKAAILTPGPREVRGTLVYLAGGTLADYEGRTAAGKIVVLEPVVRDLLPALYQARIFGAAAVVAAPRADEGWEDYNPAFRIEARHGYKDPEIPVFFLFSSGAAVLRQREGQEVVLRFPGEPESDFWSGEMVFSGTNQPSVSPEGLAMETAGGPPLLPEQRREGEKRLQALRATLSEQNRELRRPWRVTGVLLNSSPEGWIREILFLDRQILPPLPREPHLREAWNKQDREAGTSEFYDTVMDRMEELNRRVSGINKVGLEDFRRAESISPPGGWPETGMIQISRDLRRFWLVLELKLISQALSEGAILMETGREEALPRLFTPYLLSAGAVPRFLPEAAKAAEAGSCTASPADGQRWLPDLGDLFLALHLGLHHNEETRAGMIRELKYWENRSRVVLAGAEEQFLTRLEDLLDGIDRVMDQLPEDTEPAGTP